MGEGIANRRWEKYRGGLIEPKNTKARRTAGFDARIPESLGGREEEENVQLKDEWTTRGHSLLSSAKKSIVEGVGVQS